MAIYHSKFKYRNDTNIAHGLIIASFDSDGGEHDSYLGMESVYTEKSDGTKRFDYGAKFNEIPNLNVSMVKPEDALISKSEVRNILKWLTGARAVSYLDLYKSDNTTIDYSFLGRFINVKLQKNGSEVYGIIATFESVSPFAYSEVHTYTNQDSNNITISCTSDDLDTIIYPKVTFTNTNADGSLTIHNSRFNSSEDVIMSGLAANELITMDDNQIIYSDNQYKIFGEDFNYKWLGLLPGTNNITISGNGSITIQYRDIMKVADAVVDIADTINQCL